MEYEFITTNTKFTYLYLVEEKQLYLKNTETTNGVIFRCKNRDCKRRVQIKNNICEKLNDFNHHEKDGGEDEYIKLKNLVFLENEITNNSNSSIKELFIKNNIPITTDSLHKLYRLKKKLNKENISSNVCESTQNEPTNNTQRVHSNMENSTKTNSHSNEHTHFVTTNSYEMNFSSDELIEPNFDINQTHTISLPTNHIISNSQEQNNSPKSELITHMNSNLTETSEIFKQTFDILNHDFLLPYQLPMHTPEIEPKIDLPSTSSGQIKKMPENQNNSIKIQNNPNNYLKQYPYTTTNYLTDQNEH